MPSMTRVMPSKTTYSFNVLKKLGNREVVCGMQNIPVWVFLGMESVLHYCGVREQGAPGRRFGIWWENLQLR